jgi:SAM-dependent methyltransferase
MPVPKKIRIAEHIEISWPADQREPARCPNCGCALPAARLLDIEFHPPGKEYHYAVHRCSRCDARFFGNSDTMDYSTDELIEMGWHGYQVQIGAGLWSIAAPLAQIDKPAAARVLEIGGAYGFGLDFAERACNWTGTGYDPSPLAAFGAAELGLDIKQDYFGERELDRGCYDVILATEVIEHLPDPPAFLRLMARALAPDGLLLLTTPDGTKITPGLSASELLPMLSPGAHLVLQSPASLRLALQQAGFRQVVIRQSGLTLIAYASVSAFELHNDAGRSREMYRRYLVERGRIAAPGSDLCLGFAGRALFEAVNDADFTAAQQAWEILLPATRQRYGIDLECMTELPGAAPASLSQLLQLMPVGLGMILYARGIWQLFLEAPRTQLLPRFRLALAALDALLAALAQRSLTDGLTIGLRECAMTEIALCLAAAGDADCVGLVMAMRDWSNDLTTAWRVFISLVNGGFVACGRQLQQAAGLYAPQEALESKLRLDALFTTGVLALEDAADWPRALSIFTELRSRLLRSLSASGNVPHLFWPGLRGEVTALRHLDRAEEARKLLQNVIPAYAGAPADLMQQLAGDQEQASTSFSEEKEAKRLF